MHFVASISREYVMCGLKFWLYRSFRGVTLKGLQAFSTLAILGTLYSAIWAGMIWFVKSDKRHINIAVETVLLRKVQLDSTIMILLLCLLVTASRCSEFSGCEKKYITFQNTMELIAEHFPKYSKDWFSLCLWLCDSSVSYAHNWHPSRRFIASFTFRQASASSNSLCRFYL